MFKLCVMQLCSIDSHNVLTQLPLVYYGPEDTVAHVQFFAIWTHVFFFVCFFYSVFLYRHMAIPYLS